MTRQEPTSSVSGIDLAADQNPTGLWTFGQIPVLPGSDPTTDNQAVRRAYALALLGADFAQRWTGRQLRILTVADLALLTDGSSGTGSAVATMATTTVASGTTAGGVGKFFGQVGLEVNNSGFVATVDWATAMEIVWIGSDDRSGAATPQRYARFKIALAATTGTLGSNGVGIEFPRNGATFNFHTHDGVALETTAITKPLTNVIQRMRFVHTPATSVELYVNDVLVATHTTRVPTGAGSGNIVLEAELPSGSTNSTFDTQAVIIAKDW
ncbi:hypothetical protein LCGC14_0595180 [marine sediment metagenome]|uniref:Uncharacterized protein n=1 Tax=marine sediment metagenome TaxID=412755 RepID=A0A0F9RH78_9ZZZZ